MLETNFPPVLIFGQTGDSRQHSLPISGYRGRPPLVTCARQVDACAVRPLNRGPLRLPCDPSGIGALDRRHTPEITKVAPWPRLPEGTVTDHPHQCGAWAGPLYALPCRVCIRALPVCWAVLHAHSRAACAGPLQATKASRACRFQAIAGDRARTKGVNALARFAGVSQKPQLSFGDGLHGCSAASKTTRPGP